MSTIGQCSLRNRGKRCVGETVVPCVSLVLRGDGVTVITFKLVLAGERRMASTLPWSLVLGSVYGLAKKVMEQLAFCIPP